MLPNFKEGDFVLSLSLKFWRQYRKDDVVIIDHLEYGRIIKRVMSCDQQGVRITGDNPVSTSSDKLGLIQPKDILGKVVMHFKKPN